MTGVQTCALPIFKVLKNKSDMYPVFMKYFELMVVGFISFLFLALISIWLISLDFKCLNKTLYTKSIHTVPIISLSNSSVTQGKFFLGCGRIDNTEYYFCMEKINENTYKRKKVKTNNTDIVESDKELPNVSHPVVKFNKWLWLSPDLKHVNTSYTITVPKHTIIKEFSIK